MKERLTKKELRQKMILLRRQIEGKQEKSKDIMMFLIEHPLYQKASVIALYHSMKDEVSTQKLISYSLQQGKRVLLPKVVRKKMIFVEIGENTIYETSSFSIEEPVSSEEYPHDIDLMIVPGVAFTKDGYRLGYGGGYYDRYLKGKEILTIGVCFEEQIVDFIPIEEQDIRVNIVQTNYQLYTNDVKCALKKQVL